MQMIATTMQTLEQIAPKNSIFAEILFVYLDNIMFFAIIDNYIVIIAKDKIVFEPTFPNIAPTDIINELAKIIAAMRHIFLLLPAI